MNIVVEWIRLLDIRLDNIIAQRSQNGDSLTQSPSYVQNKRFSNVKTPTSGSKSLGNCSKRKEPSPPAEQKSHTQENSSSNTPYVKDPISRKKAHSTCEVSFFFLC